MWSNLPDDILASIMSNLGFADRVRFGSVCALWKSLAGKRRHLPGPPELPWLLLSEEYYQYGGNGSWGFLSLSERRVYNLPLSAAPGGRCFGSSFGWLMMTDGVRGNFLSNPFTRQTIQLPQESNVKNHKFSKLISYWEHCISYSRKAVFSSSPATSAGNLDVVLYGDDRLAFCRPGDEAWSFLDGGRFFLDETNWPFLGGGGGGSGSGGGEGRAGDKYDDVIFHKGVAYVLTTGRELLVFKFGRPDQCGSVRYEVPPPPDDRNGSVLSRRATKCLVESARGLLMVVRYWDPVPRSQWYGHEILGPTYRTTRFRVFQLARRLPRSREWAEVENLDGQILLLGTSCSRIFSAAGLVGFSGNCIYFTAHVVPDFFFELYSSPHPGGELHVFRMEDGSIERFWPRNSPSLKCLPIWFRPEL